MTDNTEKPPVSLLWAVGIFLLTVLNNVLVTASSVWIFLTFWDWFILGVVPGAPALNMVACFGISFVYGYIKITTTNIKLALFLDKNDDVNTREVYKWLGDWILNGFCLVTGALWHFWLIPLFGW